MEEGILSEVYKNPSLFDHPSDKECDGSPDRRLAASVAEDWLQRQLNDVCWVPSSSAWYLFVRNPIRPVPKGIR